MIQRILPLLATLVLVLLFVRPLSAVVVTLDAATPTFVVANTVRVGSTLLELHVCPNATKCDPQTTDVNILLDNVTFPSNVVVSVFGYAPTGEHTFSSWSPDGGSQQMSSPVGYTFTAPCPYRSLNILIQRPRAAAAAVIVFNGSFCNANATNTGVLSLGTNETTDIVFYNFVLRQSSMTLIGQRLGTVAVLGSILVLAAGSTIQLLDLEARGTPWNATFAYLMSKNPEYFRGSLLPYFWQATHNSTSTTSITTLSPSLWLELGRSITVTDSSSLIVANNGVQRTELRRGAVVVVGTALVSIPPTADTLITPFILVSQSSTITFLNAIMTSASNMSYQYGGALFIGPSQALADDATIDTGASIGLDAHNRNQSLQLVMVNNGSIVLQNCIVNTTASSSSAAIEINLHGDPRRQQQLSSTTVSGGAMWLENSSSVLLDNANVQSSIAAGILINAINTSQFSILWSNASGVALKGGSVVTSNGTFGVALDCSASVSLMFFVVQNSFIDVTGGSIVSGRVAGLYINVNDAQNATLAILYGSRITASGTGTVVRGGVLQAASGGSGLLLSAIRSTNTSLTMDNAALGAITGGRCSGTRHAVAIDASYSQQFQVAANNTAVIGARSCGVLEVSVPLPLSSPGNSTLLMSLLQAEDASVILNGNSIVGVLGFPTLTCSTTVTVSGSGLVATAVLPDSIFGPSYSMAAVDFFASFSVRTRLIINTTSVIGVVGPLAGLLIGLGNQPNASLVAVNFDDSIGCTVVISGPSGIGLVDGLNMTLLPTRGIVTRGSTVVFTSVRAAVLQADLSDGAIIGVSDATATSSDGRILLWNMAASTNSAVAIGSACTVGALFRLQSCIITDKATGSVTKSNNLTASTLWEIVRVALTNASEAMVTVKGPGAALGVTSTDCTSTLPITVKTSSIVKSAALLRLDASYSTKISILLSSGGSLGVTLGLAGQQSVQITKEWVLLDFRDSSLATVFVSDDNSVVGVWSTTYRATQLSSTFGTGLMYVYGSMSNALSILVKDGATWGVTRVTAPDAAQIASPALVCVYIDLQQSNSTTVQVSGPNSLYGVGNSNLSLRYTGNANTFYLSCNFTRNVTISVSSGAVMGVTNSLVKGVWNVNIRFASSVGLSLIVDANARVGSVNTTIGPYGAVYWTCTSAVDMSIAITSNSSIGIVDNSVFILAPPYPSAYGLVLDLTTTVRNSLILAGSSCFGLCDGVNVQGISTAVGFTLSASVGASITADDHSVIGVRGINTFVNATVISQIYAPTSVSGLLISVSQASVFGAADHCVLIATNIEQKGAISILYYDSKGTTILAREGSVVGVRNNVTLTSLYYGLYLGGYTDSNFFANFTDKSVYGFVDCSQIHCAYTSVTAYAYAAFQSSIRFSNRSTFGAVNSTLTTEQGTIAVYYGTYGNATAPVVQFSEGSVLGVTDNSVSHGAIMVVFDSPTIGGGVLLLNTGSVLGATRNSSVVGLDSYSVFVQPAQCANFSLFIWNRSVVGVSDGGVIKHSTLAATQGVTLYAYGSSNMVVSILGGSAFGVLPICPFGPNSSVAALLDTCVSRASSFRRSYITPFPMVYISLSTTFSSFLTVQDSSLIGIASLPWPQTNGAGDNVCTNATDQHPCPLTKTSITALVWVEAQRSFSATISVLDGSCAGICVEARPPEFDVSDQLLRGYLLLPNSTYFTLQWVTLSLKSAQSTTVTLRNDSTFGARLENSFQDPGYFACVSPSPKRFALVFVVIDGLGTRNALIQVSQRSSFAVVFRVDAVIFQSSASQIIVNFTGAFGPQIIISNESSLAETRLVAPQFPKPMTWPSPSCSAYESNKTLFTTTGLYNGVINSATYFPNNAALIYITLTSVTIGTVSITDGSHLSLITTSGDDYVSNAEYNRSVTASLWATTFVTQGCAMMLDVSRSVYMRIDVSGSSSSGGSSVLGIYGNLTRTLSENDSGGGLFLAAQTAFFSLSIVSADGSTLSTPAMSSVIAIGRGAVVLRNRSTIPIVSFLMCTDLSTLATSSLCTAPGFTATLSGTNTAMISVNDIYTNLTGQSSPIRASSITSDILQVGDRANTILPVILIILPCPLDRTQTPQNASWWSINFAAGASAVRIGHGAHVSGLPANPDIEPNSLAVGVFTAATAVLSSSALPSYANVVLNYSSLSSNSSSASSAALIYVLGDATVVGRVRVASTDPNQTFAIYTYSLASSSPVTTTWLIYMDQCRAVISLLSADVSASVPLFQSASPNTPPWLQQNAPVEDVERAVQERRSIICLQVTMYGGDDNVTPMTSSFGTVYLNHVDFATASGATTKTSFTSLVVDVIENATRLENASLSSSPPLVWWPQLLKTLAASSTSDTNSFVLPTNSSARAVTADFHTGCITIDGQEVRLFESTSLLLDNTTRPKISSGVVGYVPVPIPQSPEDARGVQLNWAQLKCSSTTSASLSEGTRTVTTFTKSLPSMSTSEMSLTGQSMTQSPTPSFTSTFTDSPNATPSHTPATPVPSHSFSATGIPTVTISVSPTQPTQVRLSSSRSWNATASGQPTLSHDVTASPIQTQSTTIMPSDSDTASRSTTPSHTRRRRSDSASLVLPATMTLESSLSTTHPSLPITGSSSQVMPLTETNQSTPTMTIIVRKNSRPEIPAAVSDVVGGTTVVTAVLSPAGALGARRLSLMMGLGSCSSEDDLPDIDSVLTDPLDVTASPTGLPIGPDYGATHRGAVIGNIIICVAAVFVGFLLTLVVRAVDRKRKKESNVSTTSPDNESMIHATSLHQQKGDHHNNTIIESAATLRLPGLFFIVVALFYQQVIVSSMLLLVYPSDTWESSDRSIGACGLVVSFIIIASMSRVLDPRKEYFRAVPVEADESELHELHQYLFPVPRRNARRHSSQSFVTRAVNTIVYFFAWLQAEKVMWISRGGSGDALFVERYGFLFEGCDGGRQWWVIGEMLGTIALSGLSAFVPESIPECLAALWSSVAVSVVQLLMTLVLRPMNSRFENAIVIGLAAIQVAVGLCQALAAPDMVSFVLSALAATLSALLVLATLAHIVRSRLRGISRLLKSQRRQFLPRKQQKRGGPSGLQESLLQQQRELLGLPSSASLVDFKGPQHSRALDDVVLPPIEQLDLLSIVDIICVATKERNKRFSRNLFSSDVHDAGKTSGFVDDPADLTRLSRLSVKFPMGHRPKRRLQIPDLPDEFAVELSELHAGHPEPLHDTSNNGGVMESHLALSFRSV